MVPSYQENMQTILLSKISWYKKKRMQNELRKREAMR